MQHAMTPLYYGTRKGNMFDIQGPLMDDLFRWIMVNDANCIEINEEMTDRRRIEEWKKRSDTLRITLP